MRGAPRRLLSETCAAALAGLLAGVVHVSPAAAQFVQAAPGPKQPAAETPKKPPRPAKSAAARPAEQGAPEGGAASRSAGGSAQAIIALINDEPITGYEVEQRQRFMGLSANIGPQAQERFKAILKSPQTSERLKAILAETIEANRGKTKDQIIAIFEEKKKQFAVTLQKQAMEGARSTVLPGLKKAAMEELIDERLKLQEAKRLNLVAGDDEAERLIKSIAERNKMTVPQFEAHLKTQGVDLGTMRARFKATLSWNEVVRRKFGHQISITERDVERVVASTAASDDDGVELKVQRITLAIPAQIDQKLVAQRLQEADKVRRKFGGCKTTAALTQGIADATFEDLGARKPSAIPEPTRSLLLNARDGEMLPPSVGQGGVELWSVCSRTVVKADEQKRTQAQEELRQKEFELLAKRHLKDLRQDAHIEYR
jgi:peptidyl-prolyl cis-trans isomerase SurA